MFTIIKSQSQATVINKVFLNQAVQLFGWPHIFSSGFMNSEKITVLTTLLNLPILF